jgi:hypothetical protein
MTALRHVFTAAFSIATVAAPAAAEISKDACIDSHSRGQDAREQGKLSLARKLFTTCAQSGCPSLVQGDCARFADDLMRLQPTLSCVARAGNGSAQPDTTVYLDDMLLVTRLDDGKQHDVDPGRHVVKFVHGDKQQVITVVVNNGEKGRTVAATFRATSPAATAASTRLDDRPAPMKKEASVARPTGAKVVMIAGAILAAGGGTLGVVGLARVPDACSVSTHQCAAPPGDPAFEDARSAMQLTNVGFIASGIGVVALVGGAVWYVKGARQRSETRDKVVTPWLTPDGTGIALGGRF